MSKNIKSESVNHKGQRHGYCERYFSDGKLWFKAIYVNGKRHGYWESYLNDGKLGYKRFYIR